MESHDGTAFQLQAEMAYDGRGNRLKAIAYANGAAITIVMDYADEILNPTNVSWKQGRDVNRPYSWFNVVEKHPQWLKDRMQEWPDENFYWRSEDKNFAVLTPNQQGTLCGYDNGTYPASCAALGSTAPEP